MKTKKKNLRKMPHTTAELTSCQTERRHPLEGTGEARLHTARACRSDQSR